MKCRKCKNEKIRIMGDEYCPHCAKKDFDIKKHINEPHIESKSVKAMFSGFLTAFLSFVFVATFLRTFLSELDIPEPITLFLGVLCFGLAGAVIKYFDSEYYLLDSFVVSLVLAVGISITDWYSGTNSYMMTFFSSILVFFITIVTGSLISNFFIKKKV
ncbi:DUF1761 domain-containing protein [bacterium]|nr:DUF1761 domain-containing protein [bacterium]